MSVQATHSIEVCGVKVESLEHARKAIIDAHEQLMGKPINSMEPDEYAELVKKLDKIGFFALRGAATYLSKRIGISKVTVYNIIKKNRQ